MINQVSGAAFEIVGCSILEFECLLFGEALSSRVLFLFAQVDHGGMPLLSPEARRALRQMTIEELFEHQHTALKLGKELLLNLAGPKALRLGQPHWNHWERTQKHQMHHMGS